MKERLLEFVRHTGMPVYQFEKVCGLSNAYIKNISKGIGADKLEKILNQFPQLNRVWLLTGNGDMLLPSATNVSIGDNIHHNSGNVATHGAHITNITTIPPPTTPATPTIPAHITNIPAATPATPSATTPATPATSTIPAIPTIPTTPAIPATDDDKDRLIAQLQSQIATLQARVATLQSQIAELKADKQNLMQLLTNPTQNK